MATTVPVTKAAPPWWAPIVGLVLLAACSASPGSSSSVAPPGSTLETGTSTAAPSTPRQATTTTPVTTRVTRQIGVATDAPPPDWTLVAELTYGPGGEELGVADTHGGATPPWGPEYAAPDHDGNLWVLDTNKHRVARFDHHGQFLDAVEIPDQYAGVQMPFVVGSVLWASGGSQGALIADRSSARRIDVNGSWTYSDGTLLYDSEGNSALDPSHPLTPEYVGSFRTPNGVRFGARVVSDDRTDIEVRLPDTARVITVDLVTASGAQPEVIAFEVQADLSGRLLFFVYGIANDQQLAGFFTVDASSGAVSECEPMRDPFSPSDPGSPAHLRVIPGATSALAAYVDSDALRVYQRDWPERPFSDE